MVSSLSVSRGTKAKFRTTSVAITAAYVSIALASSGWAVATNESKTSDPERALWGISNSVGHRLPPQAHHENNPYLEKQFTVEIENFEDGKIERVNLDGNRQTLGHVQRPATGTVEANDGFRASKYSQAVDGTPGHLLATSVYVLRSKVGPDALYDPVAYSNFNPAEDERDWTTRLLDMRPDRYLGADHGNWLADTIYTDIPGGEGIFGGTSSLPTGAPLRYWDDYSAEWQPIGEYFADDPEAVPPERLQFTAYKPSTDLGTPTYLEFENWASGDVVNGETKGQNGSITVGYPGGIERHVADVVQRVEGIGRFGGTEFAEIGQMDTNHPGALTFSTSPRVGFTWDPDDMGGFQIVPANHVKFLSNDVGQDSFIGKPQWLIVGPINSDPEMLYDDRYIVNGDLSFAPGWEASAPIFGMYARAIFDADDLGNSTYFEVSNDFGDTWSPAPEFVGVHDPSNCTGDLCPGSWTNIRVHLAYGDNH